MGYPTTVQVIQRQDSQQWYVGLPAALARSLELHKGERIEWSVQDRQTLVLRRVGIPRAAEEKKKRRRC